jgi:hypothetical protein
VSVQVNSLSLDQHSHFYDRFRVARIAASRNAEDFESALQAVEEFGRALTPTGIGMGSYKNPIAKALGLEGDSDFSTLYDAVRLARNDAVHEGARARHLAANAISLLILMGDRMFRNNSELTLGHFMVRDPVVIQSWMPVANARTAMLRYSFSSIPVEIDGAWRVIMDHALISFLDSPDRDERIKMTVRAANAEGLHLPRCRLFEHNTVRRDLLVKPVSDDEIRYPVLVTQKLANGGQHVVGIVSAFDLL